MFAWRRSRARAVTDGCQTRPPRKLARRANSGHDNLKVAAGHFDERARALSGLFAARTTKSASTHRGRAGEPEIPRGGKRRVMTH